VGEWIYCTNTYCSDDTTEQTTSHSLMAGHLASPSTVAIVQRTARLIYAIVYARMHVIRRFRFHIALLRASSSYLYKSEERRTPDRTGAGKDAGKDTSKNTQNCKLPKNAKNKKTF
jgi:hypothetical protein